MHTDEHRYADLTHKIIGCAYAVANTLGAGFLEKVYENALVYELRKAGLHVAQQESIKVYYDGMVVGEYVADIVVEEEILIELKACQALNEVFIAQCLNYLKATHKPLCLLMNFGKQRIEIKRLAGPSLPTP
ncbi:MAG: GxxExxY protein [Phycisphaerae bacterium]